MQRFFCDECGEEFDPVRAPHFKTEGRFTQQAFFSHEPEVCSLNCYMRSLIKQLRAEKCDWQSIAKDVDRDVKQQGQKC